MSARSNLAKRKHTKFVCDKDHAIGKPNCQVLFGDVTSQNTTWRACSQAKSTGFGDAICGNSKALQENLWLDSTLFHCERFAPSNKENDKAVAWADKVPQMWTCKLSTKNVNLKCAEATPQTLHTKLFGRSLDIIVHKKKTIIAYSISESDTAGQRGRTTKWS